MKVYCVSYDLNKSGKDYKGLIDELKKQVHGGIISFNLAYLHQ